MFYRLYTLRYDLTVTCTFNCLFIYFLIQSSKLDDACEKTGKYFADQQTFLLLFQYIFILVFLVSVSFLLVFISFNVSFNLLIIIVWRAYVRDRTIPPLYLFIF